MKKLVLAILLLGSLSVIAQQRQNVDPKLEAIRNEKDPAVLQQKVRALENGSAEDLMLLLQYYNKDSTKKNTITRILNKKYPTSEQARMARMTSFLTVKGGPEKTEAHFKSMKKEYPNINLDLEKNLVALAYAEVPNAEKVMEYINSMVDPVYKVMAIAMAIDLIVPVNSALALDLATKELERAKKLKGQTAPSEPLKADPKAAYNDYINMYSKLLFKAGKNEEAYKYTTEAYKNIKNRDSELAENYAFLSSLNGKYEESLPVLAKAVKEGKFEKRYVDQVRAGYAKLNPGKDVDAYITELQKDFIDKMKAHASKLLINEAAPDFYVTDVNGKKVTLADFKGKTIVLDFWATWCGPCVASFPAMQMAVNRYTSDPAVKFLFIHTWENAPDPLTDAKAFLNKRNYAFDLYMDPRNPSTKHSPAADAFGIDGIPAKFIIDGNGKMRFKVSGFEGKDEAAAEEIVQMIELARKVETKKKASVVLGGLPVGTKAPEFKADEWLSEIPDMKGKFVALDFWGTHCKPCIAGFAHINELHRKYKDKIVFIATTEQAKPGVPEDVYTFQGGAPIEFYSMLKKSFDAYNVQGIPYMVVVDPKGIVRFSGNGHDLDDETLRDLFAKYGSN